MVEFLAPASLWALTAAAVPLVLHLLQRRAVVPRDFPPAVLLEAGAADAARARRLRELLLLTMRMACLTAVALAFSRPTIPFEDRSVPDEARPAFGLVVVIDDSPSSGRPADPARPGGPTRLSRALAEVRTELAALGPESEAAVIFASGRSAGPAAPGDIAGHLPATATPSSRADMSRALSAIDGFLEAMQPLPGAVLVLSDCERGALPPEALARTAGRSRLAVVDLGAAEAGDDWALTDAHMTVPRLVAGEPGVMVARVLRAPAQEAARPATRRLELVLDGVAVAWRDLTMEPGTETGVELEFAVSAGAHLGELRLTGSDPWPTNDRLPVALAASAPPRVAVVAERRELAGAAEAVQLALSAGPGTERKAFLAESLAAETAALEDLAVARAIFLIGPPRLPPTTCERLARAVAAGTGAVVFASDPEALDALAVPLGLPVPAAGRNAVDFPAPARLSPTEAGARFFAPFRRAAEAGCFQKALVLDPGGGTLLARLRTPGTELPGIVERAFGRSAVLVMASGPQRGWSSLAGREQAELFVPLTHELAARAAGLPEAEFLAAPGGVVEFVATGRERGATFWLMDGTGIRVPAGCPDTDLRTAMTSPTETGAFRLLSEADGTTLVERTLAVRLPPAELSGDRRSAARIAALTAPPGAAVARIAADRRAGRELSGWLAALALFLLAAELAAARLAPLPASPGGATPGTTESARAKRGSPEAST